MAFIKNKGFQHIMLNIKGPILHGMIILTRGVKNKYMGKIYIRGCRMVKIPKYDRNMMRNSVNND